MNTFLKWLVISSADPDKASATIKGVLLQWLSIAMAIGTVYHLPFTQSQAYNIITDLAAMIGALLGIFGLGRKIYYEIKGTYIPQV